MPKDTIKIPKYVLMLSNPEDTNGTAMILTKDKKHYYRPAGIWECGFKIKDGKMYSICPVESANNKLLVKTTYKEFKKQNAGYL